MVLLSRLLLLLRVMLQSERADSHANTTPPPHVVITRVYDCSARRRRHRVIVTITSNFNYEL